MLRKDLELIVPHMAVGESGVGEDERETSAGDLIVKTRAINARTPWVFKWDHGRSPENPIRPPTSRPVPEAGVSRSLA